MADLRLDDQNLANGTTPFEPDFVTFDVVMPGYYPGTVRAVFSDSIGSLGGGLSWSYVSSSQLTGSSGGVTVVVLEIVNVRFVSTTGDYGDVIATVSATLLDNYSNHYLPGDETVQLGFAQLEAYGSIGSGGGSGLVTVEISDDVPVANADVATAVNGFASGNVVANDIIGADACETFSDGFVPGPLVAVRVQGGTFVNVSPVGTTIIGGAHGTLEIDAYGTYSYSAPSNSSGIDVFEYLIQDCEQNRQDGDYGSGSLTIDLPDLIPEAGTVSVMLDDDVFPGGIPGGPGDDPNPPVPLTGQLIGGGGDQPITFALHTGGASGAFSYDTISSPGSILVLQGGTIVVTVTLTDTAIGAFQIVQNAPISHSFGDGVEGNEVLSFGYTVTDRDGDVADGTLLISLDDDTPFAGSANALLDEDSLAGGNAGGPGDDPGLAGPVAGAVVIEVGADVPGTYALSSAGAPAGFSYDTATAGTLYILQGGVRVVTVTLPDAATPAFEVELNAPIKHTAAGTEDNQQFTITYTVTDSDGDVASGALLIDVDDDTPIAEDDEAEIIDGAGVGSLVIDVLDNDSYGADEEGPLTFAAGTYGAVTLNSDGTQTYTLNALGQTTIADLADGDSVTDTISYRLVDGDGDSVSADLVVTLIGKNGPPEFTQDEYVFLIWEDNHEFDVTAVDPDDDPIDYSVAPPGTAFGVVSGGEDGAFTYTPTITNPPVIDGLTVVATDPEDASSQVDVTLLVAHRPDLIVPLAGLDFLNL